MDTAVEQKQPKWISSLPIVTVVGYVVLVLALMLTGQGAGYSSDTIDRLVDHILAKSFEDFLVNLVVWGLLGKSLIAKWSRADMNKVHFGIFLLAVLWASVGIFLLAQHTFASVQNWNFNGVAIAIGLNMALEYLFVVYRKPAP